jgi:hypothetical protein
MKQRSTIYIEQNEREKKNSERMANILTINCYKASKAISILLDEKNTKFKALGRT